MRTIDISKLETVTGGFGFGGYGVFFVMRAAHENKEREKKAEAEKAAPRK